MMLEQLHSHMQKKMKLDPYLAPCTIKLKIDQRPKRVKTIKLREENTGIKLYDS